MSLYKQMVIFMTLCILSVSAIILILVLEYNKNMIENQLHSNAKNSATFLALSISRNIDLTDTATMDGMINSLVDNGFYRSIAIYNEDGKILSIARKEDKANAPDWFSSTLGTSNLSSTAEIMKGWLNKGHVEVVVDDVYVTQSLWDASKSIAYIFFICTFFALLFLYILLKYLLNPLKKLNKQAQEIDNNKFIIVKEKPTTTEFASVTNAMNKSIKKLKGIFAKEIDIFRKYNTLLYTDEELKVGNRKFMMLKLENYLKHSFGCFLFVEILNRVEVKNALGYVKFSSLNTFIINSCDDIFGSNEDLIVAKLNEDTLGVLLPYQEYDDVKSKIEKFYQNAHLHVSHASLDEKCEIKFAIGATNYIDNEPTSKLLIRTNDSLKSAIKKDKKINFSQNEEVFKYKDKEKFIQDLTNSLHVSFQKLSVYSVNNEGFGLVEYIPKIGIKDNEDRYCQKLIMGLSDSKNKIILQKMILQELFALAKKIDTKQDICIKLSKDFAIDKDSINWLLEVLKNDFSHKKIKFYFECLNKHIYAKKLNFEYLANGLRKINHEFAIESYAFENNNFDYLKVLQPAYIKLSKTYILHDIGNISKDVLENIIIALGSKLIIKNIDDKEDFEKLKPLHVSYMQGTYIQKLKDNRG